jgi:hypothetical protein
MGLFSFDEMVRSYKKVDQAFVSRNLRGTPYANVGVRGDTVAGELCAEIIGRISSKGNCAGQVKELDRLHTPWCAEEEGVQQPLGFPHHQRHT